VDLPTPGSPASSTTEPGTSPPPSTRSSSPTPVGRARASSGSSSPIGLAFCRTAAARAGAVLIGAANWATLPQAWHSGQRPNQRGAVAPHSAQRYALGLVTWPDATAWHRQFRRTDQLSAVGETLRVGVLDGPGTRCTAMLNVTEPAVANSKVIGNDCAGNSC